MSVVTPGGTAALSLGFVPAGVHQLTIEKREASTMAPRLDVLFLTNDPADMPGDAEAAAFLSICLTDTDCDDGDVCTDDTCTVGGCTYAGCGDRRSILV